VRFSVPYESIRPDEVSRQDIRVLNVKKDANLVCVAVEARNMSQPKDRKVTFDIAARNPYDVPILNPRMQLDFFTDDNERVDGAVQARMENAGEHPKIPPNEGRYFQIEFTYRGFRRPHSYDARLIGTRGR
jgi:hypothetical protein